MYLIGFVVAILAHKYKYPNCRHMVLIVRGSNTGSVVQCVLSLNGFDTVEIDQLENVLLTCIKPFILSVPGTTFAHVTFGRRLFNHDIASGVNPMSIG